MGGREIERWRDNDVERSGHKHIRRELEIHALGAATGQAGSWVVGLGGWGVEGRRRFATTYYRHMLFRPAFDKRLAAASSSWTGMKYRSLFVS